MTLMTLEKILKQAGNLSPNEKLLLATRLIEGVRKTAKPMRAKDFLKSNLVGLWANRQDIGDSVAFARKLREQAQTRRHSA
jgi:hypothetical protein